MPSLANTLNGIHRGTQKGEDRPGISRTVRFQQFQVLHLVQRHLCGRQNSGVHLQRGNRGLRAGGGADIAVHAGTEGFNVPLGDGEAGGQLVAPKAIQQIRAGFQGGKEVKPAVRAAGALSGTVLQMDHKAGAGIFFTQAGGNDTHHALVPVLTGEDQCVAVLGAKALDLADGIGADVLLHRLALPVQITKGDGQFFRLRGVVSFQKVCGKVRLSHAARRIDTGREDKADLNGGNGLSQKPRLFQQGMDAHKVRMGQGVQTAGDDGAVLPLHTHHIGHCADGSQGAIPGKEGTLPAFAAQGQHQLEGNAHAGQVLEGIGTIRPMGVHHSHGVRKAFLTLVMVGNDHIHPQGVGKGHLLVSGDAAVHGDHQACSLLPQGLDSLAGKAVAIFNAAGDIAQALYAAAFEIVHQKDGRGDAVHIIVAKDGNGLSPGNGQLDALHGLVHILHQHRGEGEAPLPVQNLRRLLRGSDAPAGEHQAQKVRVARLPQRGHILLIRRGNVPAFEFHGLPLLSQLPKGAEESKITILVYQKRWRR